MIAVAGRSRRSATLDRMRFRFWPLFVAAALPFTAVVATLTIALDTSADAPSLIDSGNFVVRVGTHTLGLETFSIEGRGDSLKVFSEVTQLFPHTSGQADSLVKSTVMVANAFDYGLRMYESKQRFRGRSLTRAILMDGDTTMSVYREDDSHGQGDKLAAPPGRMYVIDTQVFTLFNIICLSLHDKSFDTRPVTLFVLGPTDSLVEARVSRLGTETIQWGARTVQAEKLSIADERSTFYAWIGRKGEMLRLSQPEGGLRVEREAPKVKRRAAPPPKRAG